MCSLPDWPRLQHQQAPFDEALRPWHWLRASLNKMRQCQSLTNSGRGPVSTRVADFPLLFADCVKAHSRILSIALQISLAVRSRAWYWPLRRIADQMSAMRAYPDRLSDIRRVVRKPRRRADSRGLRWKAF